MQIVSPVVDGVVADWDLLEKLWSYSTANFLKTDIKGLPVLVSEKPYASPSSRHKYAFFPHKVDIIINVIFVGYVN